MLLNERKIVLSILSYALDKGLSVSVNDGEEDTLDYSTDINEIFEALDTTMAIKRRFNGGVCDVKLPTHNVLVRLFERVHVKLQQTDRLF